MNNRPQRAVRGIVKLVQDEESDFELQDSSEDEYRPPKSDVENMTDSDAEDESTSDNEALIKLIRKKKSEHLTH